MSRYLDRILPADATQALDARRLIYPGLSMSLSIGPGGWRIRASGPMGAAEALLPRAGRAILPTLKALAEQVCINRFAEKTAPSLACGVCGGSRLERQGGFGGFAGEDMPRRRRGKKEGAA